MFGFSQVPDSSWCAGVTCQKVAEQVDNFRVVGPDNDNQLASSEDALHQ